MNIDQTKNMLADNYDKHNSKGGDMLMRVRITRRVLSVLKLHPDWNEDEVFSKVQNSFRKGNVREIIGTIDRELYDYFKEYWLDIIKLEPIEEGKEYDHYAQWNNAKLTKEQWVAKARAKWGDVYDYTDSVYIAGLKPITIRCIKHNYPFTVQAGNHICMSSPGGKKQGGCPLCSQERVAERRKIQHEETLKRHAEHPELYKYQNSSLSEEEKAKRKAEQKINRKAKMQDKFIGRVLARYGDKYDISKVVYRGREEQVTLICPIHGEFEITPRILLNGEKGKKAHGCYECEGMVKPTPTLKAEALKKIVREKWGRTYNLNRIKKDGKSGKVEIGCKKHGWVEVTKESLLAGKGCPYCDGRIKTIEYVIEEAKAVHGDKYDYSKAYLEKENGTLYIKDVICPTHGLFSPRYDVHVQQKCECAQCAGYQNLKSPEEWKAEYLAKAYKRFGDRFDYSQVSYINKRTKVLIRCKEHNRWFKTRLEDHVRGAGGCYDCVQSTGEAEIRHFLEKYGIMYDSQFEIHHNNPLCKRGVLRVDFYLPFHQAIIEFNGEQHYKEIPYFYKYKKGFTFEDQQIRDQTLRDWCKEHDIRLLEIRFDEVYETNKKLSKFLNVKIEKSDKDLKILRRR